MAYKILTVDDSKTIRMIVKKAFKPYNCELFEGENGVEGLALAAKEKPDLIILDITMPVMNGQEMLAKLKEEPELKDIPVIMLTGIGEKSFSHYLKMLNIKIGDPIPQPDAYMENPLDHEEFLKLARKILD